MNENEIRAIVLFFSLAYLDDALAVEAAGKALAQVTERRRRLGPAPWDLIAAVHGVAVKDMNRLQEAPAADSSLVWPLPEGLDLARWREFRRTSPAEETEVLILSNVLGFEDDEVARGLGLSAGTIRYRQSRALSRLGSLAIRPPSLRSL